MTTIALEKKIKWKKLSSIIDISEKYYDKYLKVIVFFEKDEKEDIFVKLKKNTISYNNVDDLFINELWKDVYNKVIN